jgi:hypothetical protein
VSKRAHIVLSEELIEQVDRITGQRRRSIFVEAAIREKLQREALTKALQETAGILGSEDYPSWETGNDVSAWVRSSRQQDNARFSRKTSERAG